MPPWAAIAAAVVLVLLLLGLVLVVLAASGRGPAATTSDDDSRAVGGEIQSIEENGIILKKEDGTLFGLSIRKQDADEFRGYEKGDDVRIEYEERGNELFAVSAEEP